MRWLLLLGCGLIGGAAAALVFWAMLGPGIVNLPMLFVLVLLAGLAGLVGGMLRHASEALRSHVSIRRGRARDTSEQVITAATPRLRRREVLLGLGGLAGLVATGAGFTWFSRTLLAHFFPFVTCKSFDKVQRLSWSPDGKRIVAAVGARFDGGEITIWDTATGKETVSLFDSVAEQYATVQAVAWSPDGTRIALGGEYNLVRSNPSQVNAAIIDAVTLRPIFTLSAGKPETSPGVLAIAWSPDSTRLATASGETQVWNATTGKQLLNLNRGVSILAWSPDGRYLVTDSGEGDEYNAHVWDAQSGALLTTYRGHTNFIQAAAWSPDSSRVVTGGLEPKVQVWDARTGKHLLTYDAGPYGVNAVAWSPDGSRIASAGISGDVHVWNATTGELVFLYKGHPQQVNALAWSPDGTRIASGSDDETVQIWQPD